jgi:hypothetical protein
MPVFLRIRLSCPVTVSCHCIIVRTHKDCSTSGKQATMGFMQLLLQSTLMAAGTFALGCAPLSISSLSKPRSNASGGGSGVSGAISIFSIGLLISTALSVIIPEGMSVVLSSVQNGREGEGEGEVHEHVEDPHESDIGVWVGGALCAGFLLM